RVETSRPSARTRASTCTSTARAGTPTASSSAPPAAGSTPTLCSGICADVISKGDERGLRRARSRRVLLERRDARRQSYPGMSAAVVDGDLGRREARVREGADRNAHRALDPLLRVEHRRPAHRAEPEAEPRSLISRADVLGGG